MGHDGQVLNLVFLSYRQDIEMRLPFAGREHGGRAYKAPALIGGKRWRLYSLPCARAAATSGS